MPSPTRWSPGDPVPRYVDRATAAAIITYEFFPVSERTIEQWPLAARRPNGRAVYAVADLRRHAQWLLDRAAPMKRASGPDPFANT
jgi:hypothetical protein